MEDIELSKFGVYKIEVEGTDHFYIGSAAKTKILNRKKQHLYLLRKDKHPNKYLQNCFNKYNEASLIFLCVEDLSDKDQRFILEREKYWISQLNPDLNIIVDPTNFCVDNVGEKHGCSKLDNESISVIKGLITQGLDHKEISKVVDLSSYNDRSGLISGLRYDHIWKNVDPNLNYKITYRLTSPEDEVYLTSNLYAFKRQHDLKWWVCHIYKLLRGEISSASKLLYGWNCEVYTYPDLEYIKNPSLLECKVSFPATVYLRKANEVLKKDREDKPYHICNYLGHFEKISNLQSFCHKNNLERSLLLRTQRVNESHHRGYVLINHLNNKEVSLYRYVVTKPTGEVIVIPDRYLCNLSLELGLPYRKLSYAYKSKNEVKGFSVKKELLIFKILEGELRELIKLQA
jgi:hypothetical protein